VCSNLMTLQNIIEIRDSAYQAWLDAEPESALEGQHECLYDAAYQAYSDAFDFLLKHPEIPREWSLRCDGVEVETIESPAGLPLRDAMHQVDVGCYDTSTGPVWVDVYARCEATGETERVTIQVDQDEPVCSDEHDHEWVDAGVQGHGGGVLITEQCQHCGAKKVTDTWDQRPDTGEQGFTTVRYPQQYDECG